MPNSKTSFSGKVWKILSDGKNEDLIQNLLKVRGASRDFFDLKIADFAGIADLEGAEKLLAKIQEKIAKKERILIFGDYDVDGITSTTIWFLVLSFLGAEVSARLPHRVEHGYGLKKEVFDECVKHDAKLLIATDCGISNKEEIAYGNDLGIETVVADHHTCPAELPEAIAIVDPKKHKKNNCTQDLVAAGLAYVLGSELLKSCPDISEKENLLDQILTLACLGTIADCAPLIGLNRAIVKEGLEAIRRNPHVSFEALALVSDIDLKTITSEQIGFGLAPRLNAAGRLDNPHLAFDLLRGKTVNAQKMEKLNQERRAMMRESIQEAEKMLATKAVAPLIFLYKKDWHPGVIGLIAGRIAENTNLPTFIMCAKENGEIVGSARTPKTFHAAKMLQNNKKLLTHFGGHSEAAGFSLLPENLSKLENNLLKSAEEIFCDGLPVPILEIDTILSQDNFSKKIWDEVERLEPFGVGNQKPIFLLEKADIRKIETVGSEKKHLKLKIKIGMGDFSVIAWGWGGQADKITPDEKYDLAVRLFKNVWNGRTMCEMEMLDMRKS